MHTPVLENQCSKMLYPLGELPEERVLGPGRFWGLPEFLACVAPWMVSVVSPGDDSKMGCEG